LKVGRRIQALRIQGGMSQEALAERLGVTRQSVSKWELGQASPDVDKIVQLCSLFDVTADSLLMDDEPLFSKHDRQKLRFGMYLIVKDFQESISFYEKLLRTRVYIIGANRFAGFYFDGMCISIMNEAHLPGHDYNGSGDHKFVLNFRINNLSAEYERLKRLNIGELTEIIQAYSNYYFFNIRDPDGNVIEITGEYEGDVFNAE